MQNYFDNFMLKVFRSERSRFDLQLLEHLFLILSVLCGLSFKTEHCRGGVVGAPSAATVPPFSADAIMDVILTTRHFT